MTMDKVTVGNWSGDMETAAHYMDDEIREQLHGDGYDDPQAFCDAYAAAHREKFGVEWVIN
jgi:type IV pilus biogenesis protein CpaD/CtpE